jgi:GntR family transcriptional repressor for pyruvate dehydrogenase complex
VRRPRTPEGGSDERFRPVARSRVADQVAEQLLRLIAQRRLGAGETLPGERQLAHLMGVSRASVRGALQQLKARGLIVAARGAGTRLRQAAAELAVAPPAIPLELLAALAGALAAGAARAAAGRPGGREALDRALRGPLAHGPADSLDLLRRVVAAGGEQSGDRLLALLHPSLESALRPDDAAGLVELRGALAPALARGDDDAAAAALLRRFRRPLGEAPRLAAE